MPPKEGSRMQNTVIKYEDTTSQYAIDEYLRRWHRDTERAYKWKRRRLSIKKQRIIGFIMLLLTVPAIGLLEGDATIAVITVPVGAALIFSA